MGEAVSGAIPNVEAVVVGMGAQSSVGLHPSAIAAAVRAGVDRFAESSWLLHRSDGSPMVLALLETLDLWMPAFDRMRQLAAAAAGQALAPLLERHPWPAGLGLPVLLSVPPVRPAFAESDRLRLAREIAGALPVPADRRRTGLFDTGHEGGIAALARAIDLVSRDEVELCLVGGVDSCRDIELLHWLERMGRLKGEDAPSGLLPGEAAAFLLVARRSTARRLGLPAFGRVRMPVGAVEPNPWYAERPCLAQGLTEAIEGALSMLPDSARAETTWCDLNGESWRADEWSLAYLRTGGRHGEPLRLRHPADVLGDVGAATGTMLVMLAMLDLAHPRTDAERALVFACSDARPHRSACIVERHETSTQEDKRWRSS